MRWIDYREALGIGFSDEKKTLAFANRIKCFFDNSISSTGYKIKYICSTYFDIVFEYPNYGYYTWDNTCESIIGDYQILSMLSKMVAFKHACKDCKCEALMHMVEEFLYSTLDDLKIPYEIIDDKDGLFVFPKGAKELDEANVNNSYEWLKAFPNARNAMCSALKSYINKDNPSNVADLFRKTLETFAQEFLHKEKSLENLKSDIGNYLKGKGVPADLANNFETTLQMYTNYMNHYAKHHDSTAVEFLEFIMYQTGNIIRFIITLSKHS